MKGRNRQWQRRFLRKWAVLIRKVGDYLLPDLKLPQEEQQPIGVWGQRHRRYLKEHRRATYATLFTNGKLNSYLADIDRQAEAMFFGW